MSAPGRVEDTLRALAPQVLGALVRRHGGFERCEDAVQEALIAGAQAWGREGVPEHPRSWLITVASRRLIDELRREDARRRREDAVVAAEPEGARVAPGADARLDAEDGLPPLADAGEDALTLLFLCCHPDLSAPSQLALTLRAVGGLSTAEIARAFLVPEATMAQRIARAKQRLRGARFVLPPDAERGARLAVVLQVLYLVFNEGYTASSGADLHRAELTREAIRLTRMLLARLPDDGEVAGLLALMLLTDARRAARTTPAGALIPLAEQDRLRWDGAAITEGVALITAALRERPLGPYQLQAAIAAVHAEAPSAEETDWAQVLALYELLERLAPNPVVTLNRAVAVGMVDGPRAGLALLEELAAGGRLAGHHRLDAVRAHLLERAGDTAAARVAYALAARRAASVPEQRFLTGRAAACRDPSDACLECVPVTLADRVKSDVTTAMKAGERDRVQALRLVLSELQKAEKAGDADELTVLRRERKRRLEAAKAFRDGDRAELAAAEDAEAAIIAGYLPAELGDEELRDIVTRAVASSGASTPKDMGLVMKAAMPEVDGRADGKRVQTMAKELLS